MKDWLGNDFGPGDTVLYAAGSGRSITMILATVVSINESYFDNVVWEWRRVDSDTIILDNTQRKTTVTVQPLKSSRWEQHGGQTRYIDTRDATRINPWCGNNPDGTYRHLDGGYYQCKTSGERVMYENTREHFGRIFGHYESPEGWEWVPINFKDYVQEVKEGPKPVTLTVTDNIVRMP
jgi:hypothetical protein